jgi:tripartite ATP-independent transporter DctM subunit
MEQQRFSPASILTTVEKGICIIALVCLVLIAAAESAARLFGSSVPAANNLLVHILLLLGLFSGMFTARTGEHLSIVLVQFIKNEKARQIIAAVTGCIAVFICTMIAWSSVSFVKIAVKPALVGFIPNMVFALAMPLAYGIMAIRFALRVPGRGRVFSLASLALGTAAAFPAIAKIIWGIDTPDSVYDLVYRFGDALFAFRLPLIILLIAAALMGSPLFTVIAGIALVIIQSAGGESEAVNNSIFSALTDSNIIAIPLFTLTGFLLSESRAGHRLVHSFRSLFSWIPGGMIIATVIICAFFTSFTGASGVTILALGGILFTILSEQSAYPQRFSIGLLTSAGCIGLLFPPSLPIILAGATSRTNIIHMFLGALIPGLILVIAMIVIGIAASVKVKIPVEPFRLGKAASSLKESALEIILPIFLIIGYFSGVFSLVEIGAISAVYVFVAEVLIHKDIALRDLPKVFYKALPIIGGILSIIAMAKALSYAIVDTQAPDNFARWMQSAIESKILFLLLLNLALLAVGCLMDIFSAILVILPLIAPLGAAYGIDPVHLGVIFIINLEVGFLTPPVGINLFLASYRFGKPFTQICRYVLPFLIIQLIVVLLVTYIPILSTFLPRLF